MSENISGSTPETPPGPATPAPAAAPPAATPPPVTPAPGRPAAGALWGWALAAAVLTGACAAAGAEAVYGLFQPVFTDPPNWKQMSSYERDNYRSMQEMALTPGVEWKNTALAYGLLGALLGGSLGVAGGLSRRSPRAAAGAGAAGLILGVAAGVGTAMAAVPLFYRFQERESSDLLPPLLTHLALFAAVGAAAGLALGLGRGGRDGALRGLLGGLIGGAIATFVVEGAIALGFPTERLVHPIPLSQLPRVLIHACVAVLVAVGAVVGLQAEVRPRPASAPAKPAGA